MQTPTKSSRQVGGMTVDAQDNIWVFQRPRSPTDDEMGAALNPPRSKCCVPAPSVLVFDRAGNVDIEAREHVLRGRCHEALGALGSMCAKIADLAEAIPAMMTVALAEKTSDPDPQPLIARRDAFETHTHFVIKQRYPIVAFGGCR